MKYTRQIWSNDKWEDQFTHEDRWLVEHHGEEQVITWGDGPDGRVGVNHAHDVFRLIKQADSWIIQWYSTLDNQWERYSKSTAQTWELLAKNFPDSQALFIKPTSPTPVYVYGVSTQGVFYRLCKE